ncbi:hypothetical protein Tco_0554335 [Tanacetum coccineum]
MVYQNFLREFWSIVVAYDPFPSTDQTKQRPLREFLIKFSVLNGQRPLTLDFNTFCSSTGLDYNNGKYQLLAYRLITRSEVDIGEIIYSDLVTKLLNKSRLKYVSYPRFISCALQVLLGSDYTQDENFGFLPGILSNSNITKDPSKVTDNELTAHMITVNSQKDSVSPLPLSTKPKKGKSQTVTPTLPKSQGPEAPGALSKKIQKPKSKKPPTKTKAIPPKPMEGGNIQPFDRDLTSTTFDEGTAKTTSRPEGSLGDKDSRGNKPPANMEPINPPISDPSGTGELDTQPLVLSTYADVRAFLLSDDEAQESDEDILGAGKEIDEEPQATSIAETHHQCPPPQADKPQSSHAPSTKASDTDSSCDDILKKYDNTILLIKCQLVKYLRKVSNALFARITKDNWEKHEEAAVSYADIKASIDENIAHRDQTDKLVDASMSSLDKSSNTISDLYKGFNIITEFLKEIKNVVKDDLVINKKISEATKSFTKISTNIIEVLSLVKRFNFADL